MTKVLSEKINNFMLCIYHNYIVIDISILIKAVKDILLIYTYLYGQLINSVLTTDDGQKKKIHIINGIYHHHEFNTKLQMLL